MQSGRGNTHKWVLDYEPELPRDIDPLMGWTSSADMRQQLRLRFDTREEAIAYAERHAIRYRLFDEHEPTVRPKSYADNFRWGRIGAWTH